MPSLNDFICEIKLLINSNENVFFTSKNINVKWGGFSFSKAIFQLLQESFVTGYDYYSLLSVQDYPIKTNKHIFDFLIKNTPKSIIEFTPYKDIQLKNNRLNRFYFYDYYVKNLNYPMALNLPQRFLTKILPYRKVFFTPFFGRCWWFLHHNAVAQILSMYKENNKIINFHKYSLLPEETLFPTLLNNSSLKNCLINMRTTKADYSQAHPKIITQSDIPELTSSSAFFARKFEFDLELFKSIDQALQKKE